MAYLKRLRRVIEEELRRFIETKTMPTDLRRQPHPPEACPVHEPRTAEFRILDPWTGCGRWRNLSPVPVLRGGGP